MHCRLKPLVLVPLLSGTLSHLTVDPVNCSQYFCPYIKDGTVWHCLLHLVPAISRPWFTCNMWCFINLFWLIDWMQYLKYRLITYLLFNLKDFAVYCCDVDSVFLAGWKAELTHWINLCIQPTLSIYLFIDLFTAKSWTEIQLDDMKTTTQCS